MSLLAVDQPSPLLSPPPTVPTVAMLPTSHQTFLAFDFGQRRTGVASGNILTRSATPQPTVVVPVKASAQTRLAAVGQCITTWKPDALVVGVPCHPDGAPHDNTLLAQKFARQLRATFRLPVFEVDERYSTTEALAAGAKDADAASACIILEQFLRSLP